VCKTPRLIQNSGSVSTFLIVDLATSGSSGESVNAVSFHRFLKGVKGVMLDPATTEPSCWWKRGGEGTEGG
jgi:hypothetical protein